MKRKLLIIGSVISGLIILGYLATYLWTDSEVKRNIETAKGRYSGNAEDALIAYLLDTTNTPTSPASAGDSPWCHS